jgi:hypothetical protein
VPQIRQIADVKVEQVAEYRQQRHHAGPLVEAGPRVNRILADYPAVAGVVVTLNLLNAVRNIVYSYVEPDTAMIEAVMARKAKGLVLAGTGAGALSTFEKATVTELSKLPAALARSSCARRASATAA